MNYRVRKKGVELGSYSMDDLHRLHSTGELTGDEYVQAEGGSDWQSLPSVLQLGYQMLPSSLPRTVSNRRTTPVLLWSIIGFAILAFGFFATKGFLAGRQVMRATRTAIDRAAVQNSASPSDPSDPVNIARKPIVWTTNSWTMADVNKANAEFWTRQLLSGYELRGSKSPALYADSKRFIQGWIDSTVDIPDVETLRSLEELGRKLTADTNCDPIVLTLAEQHASDRDEQIQLLQRAVAAFHQSHHKAYPAYLATVKLIGLLPDRSEPLEMDAFRLFSKAFADGSYIPADQRQIAESFLNGKSAPLFTRRHAEVCAVVQKLDSSFRWLSLVLNGEREIAAAWAARGGGYANTVSQRAWEGFNLHLKLARNQLTEAWKMQPTWPQAPERMINVSLGDSDLEEMRLWFDRTTIAQMDYPRAWEEMLWGLRPRWFGSHEAMLALGRSAMAAGRFDSEMPLEFLDAVSDVESELSLGVGKSLYGRDDIWPDVARTYEGVIRAASSDFHRYRYRSVYAAMAYLNQRYEISREQLEAIQWKLLPEAMVGWNVDWPLMLAEVAARSGPLKADVGRAESTFQVGNLKPATAMFSRLKDSPEADERTLEFIGLRLAELEMEQALQSGAWVKMLPSDTNRNLWEFPMGKVRWNPDGSVEVESGPKGHLICCKARVGRNFEIQGQMEVVSAVDERFQGGVALGSPEYGNTGWMGFQMQRQSPGADFFTIGRSQGQWIRSPQTLDARTNAFDFVFEGSMVTSRINATNVSGPTSFKLPGDLLRAGLGGFNPGSASVIRYRNVQIRKLNAGASTRSVRNATAPVEANP